MHLKLFKWILAGLVTTTLYCGSSPEKNITISQTNPYYFDYKGQPILLLGGSDEDNLFNHPALLQKNLAILADVGGNYIRCTLSCRDSGNVWPFLKTDKGLYDLERFNPEYWQRLEHCLQQAEQKDIIVQIELWATFDFYRENWIVNPFNPANNINYDTTTTRLETIWPFHPARKPQPFFFSVPKKNNDEILLSYQLAFAERVMRTCLDYPNVLYCLDNETRAPAEWAWYWAEQLYRIADHAGKRILVTEMWDAHDLRDDEHKRTYMYPDLFSFFDISQNNWQEGQAHYNNGLWIRREVTKNGGARPLTNVKVYHRRHGGLPNEPSVGLDRWWQNIFIGCASTRFHRPTGGTGLDSLSRQAIHAARTFTDEFSIFATSPAPELLLNRQANEAYCLALPEQVYAVYFPSGGEVDLQLEPEIASTHRWFDPQTSTFRDPVETGIQKEITLTSPDTLQPWLVLVERTDK